MQTNKHIGRVTKTFEMQYIGEEKIPMVRVGLAVKRFPSRNAKTDFLYYVGYRDVAERLYQYANQKGLPVEFEFTQQSRRYQNQDGETVYRVDNVIEKFMPWASLDRPGATEETESGTPDTAVENDFSPDDLEHFSSGDFTVL
ncbi:single-stranded DNA-binding protein [Weissella cibaria]|nr:single-stranded DNA-binding protein [Weissella cibaria]